jgi:hypothetical protein
LNLYALTAFAGWAHFVFAWRGQWSATRRLKPGWQLSYWSLVLTILAALVALRAFLGIALFSGLAWVWFVGHFVKAEIVFSNSTSSGPIAKQSTPWQVSYQPVLAFAWLSAVLFDVGNIQSHRWLLFCVSLLLGAAMLVFGGFKHLAHGSLKLPAVAFFFLGEFLVWGTYGPYMTPAFRAGVYVFHVAGASFFHYLGSYVYGRERTRDRWLGIIPVLLVNLAFIFAGWAIAGDWPTAWVKSALTPVLGMGWFTLWVALHLAASDLLPLWKRRAGALSR